MAKLIYSAITSLDGYTVDADGHFDWSAPDDQVHAFINDLERPVGTYLYGRRMYDVMKAWQDMLEEPNQPQVADDFARIWQAADKVVYSSTLDAPATPKTRIEPAFQADAVAQLLHVGVLVGRALVAVDRDSLADDVAGQIFLFA